MDRLKWTDDLIDERMGTIDDKFDRRFSEMHALREETRAGFADLRGDIADVRRDLSASQRQLNLIVAGFAFALLGLLGAFVAAQF